ncbi:MAG: long-chain-fatty-acid--CoA ligase [Archaeoglobaceae archaeon]
MRLRYELLIKKTLYFPLHSYPEKEIVWKDGRYNYRKFYERLQRFASGAESLGIKDAKIAFFDWNTHHYLEGMFAIPMMGSILHFVNIRLSPQEIIYTANYVKDDYVVFGRDFLPLVERIAPHIPSVKGWIATQEVETSLKPLYYYEDIIKSGSKYEFPEFDENKTACVYFTSGTTGLPKPVHFSHRGIILQCIINGLSLSINHSPTRLSSADTIMHIPPFFHGMGWTFPYLSTMFGMKQVLPGRYEPRTMLELIKREKVTYAAGVPVFLRMLIDSPESKDYAEALKGLKFVCDGEHPPRVLFERAKQFGIEMIEAFGMSEGVGFTFAVLKDHMFEWSWERQLEFLNKAGLPAPLVEVRIVDSEGKEVPRDGKTMGEILIRSPGLTEGYWMNPEKTKESWTEDGWFKTGDLGVWDEEGYIMILDRAKDVIKSGGEWISSVRLEGLILTHPAVNECAVVAARSEKWSERPIAVVTLKPGKSASEEEIKSFLVEKYVDKGVIPKWWLPERVFIVNEIPKTSVGKINKRSIREAYKDLVLP